MFEFNEDTEFILGRPNFWCAGFANILRTQGQQIDNKAEAEQAAVIFWMLNLYEQHGKDWRKEAENVLRTRSEQKEK